MKVPVYNWEGNVVGDEELPDAIFGVALNPGLIHEAFRIQNANARVVRAHTKTRGEVRGGGKKPWKQKGTGRARHGSIRSPIWKGGGVIFGPRMDRNFSMKMNRKARQKALFMCLSDKAASAHLIIVESAPTMVKTKEIASALSHLPRPARKTLLALGKDEKGIARAIKNLPATSAIAATHLNVKDLLAHPTLVITKKAAAEIQKQYPRA